MSSINNCDRRCCIYKDSRDFFVRTYISKLGPVIIGSKPIHLFNFSENNSNSLSSIQIINSHFCNCRKIKYDIFKCKNESIKMLFYNPFVLNLVLQIPENLRFLKNLGYPHTYDLESYLCHLIKKMVLGEDHHEIGIFFGYPLKDVMGFMGVADLKLTKVQGWRIYGDPAESEKAFARFKSDESHFRYFIESNGIEKAMNILGNLV